MSAEHAGLSAQKADISRGPMCALQSAPVSLSRSRCLARAASTRFLISEEGSASALPESSA